MSDSPINGTWGSAITGLFTIAAGTIDTVVYTGAVFGAGGGQAAVLQGPGTLDSSGNATVNQYSGTTTQLALTGGVTWESFGTIVQNGGLQFGAAVGDSATLVNETGAVYDLNGGNAQVTTGGAGTYGFVNNGLLEMTAGGNVTLGVPLDNTGVVSADNGNLYLQGPVGNSGTLQSDGGFLEIQGGTLGGTIQALANNVGVVGTYTAAAATTDSVTFGNAYLGWGGDGAAVFAGPGTIVTSGAVNIDQYSGAATQLQLTGGLTWDNAGTVNQLGGLAFGGSTTDTVSLLNRTGATYILDGGNAQIRDDAGGSYTFDNAGLLEMISGGNDYVAVPLVNTGVVSADNGNLYLQGAVANSGTLQSDGGFLEIQGGTLGGTIQAIANYVGLVGTYAVPAATVDTVTFENAYLGWGGDGDAVFAGPGTLVSYGYVNVNQYNGPAAQLQLIDGLTWDNAGTVNQIGGLAFGGSTIDTATIVNQAGATYLLDGGNAQIGNAGGTYAFDNAGLLEMYNGGNDTLSVPLDNTGTVVSTNGAFYLSGPVTNSGTLVASGGFLEVRGGTLGGTIEALSNSVGLVGTYAVAGGTTGTVTFGNANLGWYGDGYAVFAGPGTLVSNGGVAISQYSGAATQLQLIDGITWANAGTVNQYGGLVFGGSTIDSATLLNRAGATYVLNGGNAQIGDTAGGTYNFINAGTLKMVNGGGDTVAVPLTNTGLVTSTNGELVLAGPITNSGTMLANGGVLYIEGGTLGGTIGVGPNGSNAYLAGTYAVAGGATDTVTLAGATFGDGGGAAVAYFSGSGTIATGDAATINNYYYSNPELVLENGVTWDNFGAIYQAGGLQFGNAADDSASFVNEAGATYSLSGGSADFELGGTAGTYSFVNAGLLQQINGGGDSIAVPLDNTGVISSDNGEIYIDGPLTNSGTIQTAGGSVQINGGTLGGTLNAANGAIWLLGTYALAAATTSTVTLNSVNFGDGGGTSIAYLSGSGTLVTGGSATITNYYYSDPDLVLENGATWDNFGAVNQSGGLQFGNAAADSATVVNEAGATWTLNGGSAYFEQGGTAGTYVFVNNGLLQMINGGSDYLAVPLVNTGVVSADNGYLYIEGPLTNSGTIQTGGGAIQIEGGTVGGTLDAANGSIWLVGTYTVGYGQTDTASLVSVTFGNGGGAGIAYLSGPGTLATSGSASVTNYYYSDQDLVLMGGITWDYSGTLNVNGGLQFGNQTGDSATLDMQAGSVLDLTNGSSALEAPNSGTYTLIESGLLETTGGGTDTIAVSVDETSTGTITVANGNLDLNNGATIAGHVNGGAAVNFTGNVTLTATGDITANAVSFNSGTLFMQGGTINSANLTVGSGEAVVGYGTLGDSSLNAIITDASGGLLTVTGPVTGTPNYEIETGATLELTNASAQPVTFNGTDATLKLEAASGFSGTIENFAGGDTIDLAGITLSAVSYVGSALIGTLAAGGTISLHAPGIAPGLQLGLGTDAGGASTIYLNPSPVSAVPDLLTSLGPNNSIVLPDAHVVILAADPKLDIENAATAPADGLNVDIGTVTGSAFGNGQITSLAPQATDDSSIGVGLNDETAGAESGSVALDYQTDGIVSGVEADLGTQTLNLSGNVYRLADPSITAPANVYLHVGQGGGTYTEALTIANINPADGYSEGLDAAVNGSSGNLLDAQGATADIAAGGSDDSSITVEISTGTAGTASGYADLALTSDGTGVDSLGLTPLAGDDVPVTATIDNYATAAIQQAGGAGSLSAIGNTYTLDLGTVASAPGGISGTLDVANIATGQADWLTGTLDTSGGAAFTDTGLGSIGSLSAGGSTQVTIDLSTVNAGAFSQTITLADASTNPDGSSPLAGETIVVVGTVLGNTDLAQPVINEPSPVVLADVHVAPLAADDQTTLDIGNTGSAVLSAAVIAASGDAYGFGAITDLAPGSTDTTDIVAGLNNTQAGALTGTIDLSFTSGTNDVALPPQSVALTGGAYRYADPSVSGPGNVIVHVGDGISDIDSAALVVGNTATADGFSENLDAAALGVAGGDLTGAGGTASEVAAGATNAASATFSFSTAAAGTESGTVAVSEVSDGSTIDTLGTTVLGTVDVPVSVTVNNYATAAIQQTGGPGELVQSGSVYTLNLVAVAQGAGNVLAALDVANTAAGPADWITGSLSGSGDPAFTAYNGSGNAALSATYFEVGDTGNGPDFGSGGVPNVAIGSTLGPDGLPVASSPAGIADVDPTTQEITWWDPSLNSGVVQTGTGVISLPYSSNMYAPNSTGSNDATYYETAILQGKFSLASAGSVTFQLGSDDDSFIYVDGTLIGSNPGIHGTQTQNFTASDLAAGSHTVEVFYDDRDQAGANLNLSVLTPGVAITPANAGALGNFGTVAAGASTPFAVEMSTTNAGVFTETVTLAANGANASGYSKALSGETLVVTGTVLAASALANPVLDTPTPVVLPDAHAASVENDQTLLSISNTGSAVLSATVSAATGAAYGSGAIDQLAIGATDTSDIGVGLNNTSAGAKSGSVSLSFSSGANLVTDGSFEGSAGFVANDGQATMLLPVGATTMPGWTVIGSEPVTWIGANNNYGLLPYDGSYFLDLTGNNNGAPFSGVSQTIATTIGAQYQLTFELGSSYYYGLPDGITATAGGTSQTFTSTLTGSDNWQQETLDFTATGTATSISLLGASGNAYIGLDDVTVTPAGTAAPVALAPQTVAVSGNVYNYATASIAAPGNVILHVGDGTADTKTEALTIVNTAPAGSYSEGLDVTALGAAGGEVLGATGATGDIAAQGTDDTSLTVSISTATAATTGSVAVAETSDGTNVDTLGTTSLGTVDVPIYVTVDNYASAAMEQTGGNGSMTPNAAVSNTYTLDLGSTEQYANPLSADLAAVNAAAGPAADQLDGSYTITGDSEYSDSGFGSFSGLNFGNALGGNTVNLNTGTIGVFTQQITLTPTGTNASGYTGTLAAETIDVVGTIVPVPPPPPPPLATAVAWGDVHLTTFDGLYYNFQAEGEFILAQSTVPGDTFAVQARMAPYTANSTVSVMTMIGADVGGEKVTFGLGRDDVIAVGGTGISLANGESYALAGGGSVTQLTATSFQLNWGTGEVMDVTDAGTYFNLNLTLSSADGPNSIQGLLGSDTGQANDFQLADGTVLSQPLTSAELYGEFANAWRVTASNSLMDYAGNQTTAAFTDVNFPADAVNIDNLPAAILQQAELEVQQAGITDPNQQAAAVLDLLVTGNPNALQDDVDVGQNGETTTAAEISVPPPPVPALGVSAVATNVVETAGGTTHVTFNAYLTNATGTDTVIDWQVASPSASYLTAGALGSNPTSGFVVIPAGQTTGQFTVTLPTAVLGTDPSANLQVSISSTNGDPIFGQTAQTEIDNDQPSAGNPAVPVLTLASGSGTFSGSDGDYTLNLGTLVAGEAPLQDRFQIANDALAPSDMLAGSITAGGNNFTVYGATQLSPLAAGTSYQGLVTEANTSQTGAQSETIVLNPVDENITGYASIQASQTVTITDTVLPDAVGDLLTGGPVNLGIFYQGAGTLAALDIENAANAGAAGLDVMASSSGNATVTGAINGLGAGDADGSSIQVGINTASPGIKTGTVTLNYTSDAGDGNTAAASSQQIEVIGTVYGPATASLSAPIVYVHKGDDGGSVTVPITIANTGTNNGFTERLSGQIVGFGTYVTAASGSITDLTPGFSNSTSLSATLSDANYGTYAGEVQVALQSDGTGIDSHGTTSLGFAYVQAAIDVDQYAVAAMQEVSGNGTMVPTGVSTSYSLDLGTVAQYATPLGANIAALNDVLGQADLLGGRFSVSGAPEFTNAGTGAFGPGTENAGLAAGQEDTGPVVVLSSATVGVFTETLTLDPYGYNADDMAGYALAPETVTITGTVVAAPPPTPEARAADAWGDVHLTTFDGLYYNFQAAGEFVLSESTVPGDTFAIQARMQPYNGSSSVSINTMVAAEVGSDRVTFGVARTDTVWIDGQGVSFASGPVVTLADGTLEQTSADTYRLVWNTGEELDITNDGAYLNATVSLPSSDAGNVQGLLGNDGGNPADDLTLPGGAPIAAGGTISYAQLYGTYAASWEVTPGTSLMDYQAGQDTASFYNPNFPYNQILLGNIPADAYQEALAAAEAAGITDPNLLQAAIVDYLFTGNPQALQASENVQQQEGTGTTAGQTVTAAPAPIADVGVLANEATVVELTGTADAIGFTAYLTSPEGTATLIEYGVNGNAGPGFLNASDFPGDILPNGTVTIAAGQTSALFSVAIPASVLGSRPDANLQVVISPVNPEQSVFAPDAQTEILNTGPTAGNPATPLVELRSGDGALSGSGTAYELNLGSVEQFSNPLLAGYGVENDGIIPADLLSGSFEVSGSSQFLNSGLSPFAPIATGNADTAPEVELLTNAVGTFTENVTLTPTDSNLTNYSSIMPLVTIEVVGTIVAPPPPPPPPVPEATAWGDVHLTTFDGVYYNFQAAGEYVLTRSTVAGDTFQVQARLEPYGANSSVTVQTQVGAAIGTDHAVFALTGAGYNDSPFYLNGTAEALSIGQTLSLSDGSVTETSANTYRVNWDSGESMTVTLNGSYISDSIELTAADAGKVQGLLGPDDGNPSSDLQLPNGQSIASNGTIASSALYGEYASDWQVPNTASSLLYYGSGQSFGGFNIPGFPEDALTLSQLPANLVAAAEAIVEAEGITNPNLVDAAVIDLLVTGDPNSVFSTENVQEEGVLLNSAAVSIPTPLPSVGIMADSPTVLEPTSGTLAVDYTVYLTAAAAQTSTVDYSVTGSGPDNLGTTGIVGGNGSGVVQIAAGQTSVQIVLDVLASALGSLPEAELQVGVTATGGETLFGSSAETEIVNPAPTAGNPAKALIEQLAGDGHLTGGGTDYVLNLGTQVQNGTDLYANLGIENGATVPADDLSGQFNITNFENYLNTGFVPFSNVAPGAADTEPAIELGTGTIGVYTETVVLDPTDTNDSGYSAPMNDVTLTVTGTIVPMPLPPPPSLPTATAWGDVHLTTFDGLYYNFQAVGEFTLAKSTVAGDNFNVQIRTTQYGGSSVSVMDQVAAGFGDNQHVTFGTSASQPAAVLLNGDAATFVNGVLTLTDGSTVTEESPASYVVNWVTGESMTVNVAGSYVNTTVALASQDQNGHVEGLLGYDNGVNNDFAPIVSGTTIDTTQLYYGNGTFTPGNDDSLADYWRVNPADSLLYYANGATSEGLTNLGFPADALSLSELPAALQQEGLQEAVQAGITDPQLQQAAALDYIVTGDPGIVTGGANVQQQGITTTDTDVTGATVTPALGVSANNAALVEPGSGELDVGFTVYLTEAEAQASTVDWSVEAPNGGYLNASDFAGGVLPSGSIVIAAGSTSASFSVAVNAGALGSLPSSDLQVMITPTGTEPVFAPTAQTTIVNHQTEAGTPSDPMFALLGGAGTLTQNGTSYTLSLGNFTQGETVDNLSLAVENAATIGSNGLAGSLTATGIPGYTVYGTGPLGEIAPGASYQGLHVAVNTGVAGAYSETITLTPEDQNASGHAAPLTPLTLTITDSVSGDYASASAVSPNPVDFHNVHRGASPSQTLSVENSAPGGAENLDGSIGSPTGAATVNGGSFTGLAPGVTNSSSLSVGLNTSTEGVVSGAATVSLSSDGSGTDGNGITPLPSQTIDVFGTVYGYAAPIVSATTLDFGAARVGGTVAAQSLAIADGTTADPYQEGLIYGLQSTAPTGFSAGSGDSGTIVSGGSASASLGLNTAKAGNFTSTDTLSLTSTGAGTSGLGNTSLTSDKITLEGKVYAAAVADPITTTLNFGIVHVGSTTKALSIKNTASGALTDVLTGNVATVTGTGFSSTGSLGAGVAAGGTGNLHVTLDTTASGVFTGSATLALASHDADQADLGLAVSPITLIGTVDNYATAGISEVSGEGILTRSGHNYTLNLDTLSATSSPVVIDLAVNNTATGLADLLSGSFTETGSAAFINSGFAAFSGVGAGQTATISPSLTLAPGTFGSFTETITLTAQGTNASGYLGTLTPETLTVTGMVLPVIDLASTPGDVVNGAGNVTIVATSGDLFYSDQINGGGGTNTLDLVGGGIFDLAVPRVLANIQVVNATEGEGTARPLITLRAGTDLTLIMASAPTDPQAAGAVIHGADNTDTIYLGAGLDTVSIGGAGETVIGGSGNEVFYVNSTDIGATIEAGSGTNALFVQGGGTLAMGANITGIKNVYLQNAGTSYDFTANATAGMAIHASTDNDTITVGSANQSVAGSTGTLRVLATAAEAGVTVDGATGETANTTLEITTGGSITLNSLDRNVTVQLDAASTLLLPTSPLVVIDGSSGNDMFIATGGVLRAGQNIDGGGGTNTLALEGGGWFGLETPATLNNIQFVTATEGQGSAEPVINLRDGTDLTLTLTPAATNPLSASALIDGADNDDTIYLGAGQDTVHVGGDGETVIGGSGNDVYYVTAASIGATIEAGTGTSALFVQGGGTMTMGANITGIKTLYLKNAGTSYHFTANATAGLAIHASSDTDTITVGSASQSVDGSTGNLFVEATAANAGVYVRDGSGSNELDITTSGTATLNNSDNNLTVVLDAANTTVTLDHMKFIYADGSGGTDTIIAGAAGQVLTGGAAGDTLEDAGHYGVTFQDTTAGIQGDTLADLSKVDTIHVTDLTLSSVTGTPTYVGGYGNGSSGTLAVPAGGGAIDIHMTGLVAGGVFSVVADPNGGTDIKYS